MFRDVIRKGRILVLLGVHGKAHIRAEEHIKDILLTIGE